MVLMACDSTIKEVHKTSPIAYGLLMNFQQKSLEVKNKEKQLNTILLLLAEQCAQRNPKFTAVDIFTLNTNLLFGMIATIIAYSVILIQLNE